MKRKAPARGVEKRKPVSSPGAKPKPKLKPKPEPKPEPTFRKGAPARAAASSRQGSARRTTARRGVAIVREERSVPKPLASTEIRIDPEQVVDGQLEAEPGGRILPFEIDPRRIEEGFTRLRGEVEHWAKKGRYTKVRFKFRGKQLLPDLPLAAVVAAEGLTFYWGGILRALIFNIAGKSLINVELINDSEKRIQQGREALLTADVDRALEHFREAVEMDRDNPSAHLSLGVALKLKGDWAGARAALERVQKLAPDSPHAAEAEKVLANLPQPGPGDLVAQGPGRFSGAV